MDRTPWLVILLLQCFVNVYAFPDFLITVPAQVYSGEKFDFCVTFPGDFFDGTIEVNALMNLDSETLRYPPDTFLSVSDAIKCQKLTAPRREGYWSFNVTMKNFGHYKTILPPWFPSMNNQSATYSQDVRVNSRREDPDVTLIQTDKPLYKPGQTVRFRILRLQANKNLLPDTDKIKWVYIENPSNIRIRQWKEVPTTQGIASLEMLLSDDPPLGTWIIKAVYRDNKEYSNTFTVEEYVLPKYEVTVTPPAYLLSNSPTIDAEVCAKYTYGKPVKGQLSVKICYDSNNYGFYWRREGAQFVRPCTETILEIAGCTKVSVNSSEIELNSRKYSIWGNLQINASVTEAGTGVVLTGESKGPQVTTESCSLELSDETDGFFKPAFPYRGKVTAKNPDGTPVRQRRILIRASSYQQYTWRLRLTVTTDDNGEAPFSIRDLPENLTSFSIEARDKDLQEEDDQLYHKLSPASAYKTVTRWFSPSRSYIQIEKTQQPLACGKEAQLDVLYSTPEDTNYNFIIMVKSKNRIVYTTNKRHQFSELDSVEVATDDPSYYLKVERVITTTPRPRRTPPTPPTPKIRIANVTVVPPELVTMETRPPPILARRRRSEKSCMDNAGKIFDEGSTFAPNISDPCISCMCNDGEAKSCAVIMCDEPGCGNYRLIPGTCCGFVCLEDDELEVCIDKDGKRVQHGETYTPDGTDPCKTCTCSSGEPGPCRRKFCSLPSCKRYEMIPGTCCGFVCLEESVEEPLDVCIDMDGKSVQLGEIYTPDRSDPCKSCKCSRGEPGPCHYKFCSPPSCKPYEMIPGTCCGFVCLEPTVEPIASEASCMDKDKIMVKHGDVFAPNRSDPCQMCSCVNGEATLCDYIYCDAPQCERYELVEGTCCGFICLDEPEETEKRSCVDENGNTIEDGESSSNPGDPCKECECSNGELVCAEQFCKLPECRNFRYIEGTCCDVVCDEDEADESNLIGRVRINLPVSAHFAPEAQVIVFYVREDGEIVSSNTKLTVEKCFDNKVNMQFGSSPVRPGTNATVRVTADPGSACSIGVVDKSLELLKKDHQMTPEKFYSLLNKDVEFDYYPRFYDFYDRNCRRNKEVDFDVKLVHNPSDIPVDSYQAFQNFGLKVITNLKLETRPCVEYIYPMYNRVYAENDIGLPVANLLPSGSNNGPKKVRSFFPETWLWELDIIGDSGESTLVREIPDTITEWKGNAMCLNSFTGLGISSVSGITAFQPFFLSFTLPYSAVRNEVVPVLVTVFNYLTECLVMRVTLKYSDEFRLQFSTSSRSTTVCVCGGDSETIRYLVTPLKIGKINIQADAESLADDGTCGNSVVSREGVGVSDAVRRDLLVDAEGIENEYTYSSYLCPSGEPGLKLTERISLRVPTNRIQDSERGFINVIGDVMGPALTNLKDLLRMPYGCGEQNMASFAPNIFVLQYFYNANLDVSRIEEDALKYMRVGYQRQLQYRHSDGSYSAFGESDGKSGSTWLTGFVVKCLGQSQKYIDIDQEDLNTSISWFRRQQNEIGCFPKVGYTHSYYLKGGWGKGNDEEGTLTAFILIAMLEAGLPKNDTAVLGALRCLDLQEVKDTYMLTLMAYAYSLYDVTSTRRLEIMSLLRSKVKRKGRDMVYWSRDSEPEEETTSPWGYYRAPSAEVEMTSYALLAYTVGNQPEAVINAKPIVMWLSKQRNAQGGFSSTQDTIIALQALSVYGTLVHQGGMDITVEVTGEQMSAAYGISDENKLVLQSLSIPQIPNELNVTVRGVGCALVQANVKYNMPDTKPKPDFSVKLTTHRSKHDRNNCAKRSINICASYKGASGQTKMAIVDVKMQTGWSPVRETLNELLSSVNMNTIGLQKYEIDGNIVHLYFEYFDVHRRCFIFDVEQDIELSDPKPAYVKIYDYYETDSSVTVQYDMKTYCGTKEELPFLTPEEYDSLLTNTSDDDITQIRIPIGPPPDISIGQPGPPGVLSCPVCLQTVDTGSQDFSDLVCNSARIFKVKTARKDGVKYSMKLYADLKPRKKLVIANFANHRLQKGCACGVLDLKDEKLMIFDTKDQYSTAQEELDLSKSTTIVRWSKLFERKVFRKNKRC